MAGRALGRLCLVGALALAGTGCQHFFDGNDKEARPAPGTSTTEGGKGGAGERSSPKTDVGKVVASSTTAAGDTSLRIDLYELKRTGSVLSVNFGVTNTSAEGAGPFGSRWQISQFFDDGVNNLPGGDPSLGSFTTDGVYVVDEVNKKKYPVARDSDRRCLCSTGLAGTFVGRGQTVVLSATLGAPPPDVRTVNVSIPHVATFAGVPLS